MNNSGFDIGTIIFCTVLFVLVGICSLISLSSSMSIGTSQNPKSINSPNNSVQSSSKPTYIPSTYIGCYGDKPTRAIPLTFGVIKFQDCVMKAKEQGSPLIGFQAGDPSRGTGHCFYGPSTITLSESQKYGKFGSSLNNPGSTNCKKIIDVSTTQMYPNSYVGGGWTNAIYKI